MNPNQIQYYRVERTVGTSYFAAESREVVYKLLGNPENPMSHASLFGYRLNTLERITEEQAREAPYFKAFAKETPEFKALAQEYGLSAYELYVDGTWMLGTVEHSLGI